jgi:hypothetical protein
MAVEVTTTIDGDVELGTRAGYCFVPLLMVTSTRGVEVESPTIMAVVPTTATEDTVTDGGSDVPVGLSVPQAETTQTVASANNANRRRMVPPPLLCREKKGKSK